MEKVIAHRIDSEEFRLILADLESGKRVSQQEVTDAAAYADALPELIAFNKALQAGWQIAMTRLNYKNQRIGRLERQIAAVRRRIQKEAGNENS